MIVFARILSSTLGVLLLLAPPAAARSPAPAQDPEEVKPPATGCTVNLDNPGAMKDIVSNALTRGLQRREAEVAAFLQNAETTYATGPELMRAAAKRFEVGEAELATEVQRFKHCNCDHGPLDGEPMPPHDDRAAHRAPVELTAFARDVTLHVVLHELGHALVREFDLPILGNEETMADAFATHFLVSYLPDRAVEVLLARTKSLLLEARAVPRADWPVNGEHDSDARRAFQIAALAIAADPVKYAAVGKEAGMSERDLGKAKDYGAEIHRSWRRVLAPLSMPPGVPSREARVVLDAADVAFTGPGAGLLEEIEASIRRFDWHSQVTVRFVPGNGGAMWSRGKRTITVHSDYLRRFIDQGKASAR